MSKGGVYKMNKDGKRELVTAPTRPISSPEHKANKAKKAERKKLGRAGRLQGKPASDNQVPGDAKPARNR